LEPEKSGAEADWILDAAAGSGLARETKAMPASMIPDEGEQSVNSKNRRHLLNDGVSYPKLAHPEVDYGG
jgi:hypothetical protein